MPRARSSLMCLRLRGWLFDELPNASYSALTLTPSAALAARISNRSMAMESFLKLKYSRWTEWRACLMAANKSSNFCCPVIRSVTLLPAVNTSPSRRRSMARRLSDGRPLSSSTSVPPAACAWDATVNSSSMSRMTAIIFSCILFITSSLTFSPPQCPAGGYRLSGVQTGWRGWSFHSVLTWISRCGKGISILFSLRVL